MKYATEPYSFIKKGRDSKRFCAWSLEADSGLPSGLGDFLKLDGKGFRIEAGPRSGFGDGDRNPWFKRFWPFERSWKPIKPADRLLVALGQRASQGAGDPVSGSHSRPSVGLCATSPSAVWTGGPYRDSKGHLRLPLAQGKVSFIRKVDPHGYIDVHGVPYFIRRKLAGQYIMATVFTLRKKLVIKQQGRNIKSFPFRHNEFVVSPLLPIPRGKT